MKSEFSNKEVGDIWTGYILGRLFEKHPKRIDVTYEDTYAATGVFPVADDPKEMWDDLIVWLNDHRFIAYKQSYTTLSGGSSFFGVCLTERGLRTLSTTPSVLAEKTSVGDALSGLVKQPTQNAISALMGEIVGGFLKGLTGA